MPRVTPKHPKENFEPMFNRFKRLVDKAGTMDDYYKHEFYEKPSKDRARRKAAAVKREQRRVSGSNMSRSNA